ncbi:MULTISPECIES: hypothetical protein [Aeromonas]|uniref:Uncharacterized protein n=1 Tax=Aeromonas veronii TaxID=654 RepID=A0A4S5CH72_AERVE|nr:MULTISPECIES: hypothetical protein [Aeromonas]THJ45039.1 hypothetical protein E8Q35_12700 [Aeromonas veronii]
MLHAQRCQRFDENLDNTLGPVEVFLDLSAPQHSITGRAIHQLMYRNQDLYEMAPNPSGTPHTGGEHSFCIKGSRQEVNAWLDLFAEAYPSVATMVGFVKAHVRKEFVSGNWRQYNRINFKLKNMKTLEQKEGVDQPVAVCWFRSQNEKNASIRSND